MMRFLVRKATSVGIAPTLLGFTRHYSLRPSPPPDGKLAAFLKDEANASMCFGVSATAIFNFLYWVDFSGFWAQRAADDKEDREMYAQQIERVKRSRERLEARMHKMKERS